MTLSNLDWAILAGYVVMIAFVVMRIRREKRHDEESYLLDGRRLTLPSFVATTVSTWYGGILAVGEYSYQYGLSNWLVFGVPYYLAALIFALFLAKRVRRSQLLSIPDQLDLAYGRKVAVTGSVFIFVMTVPASYILMLGILLELLFGGALLVWIVVAAIISSVYVLIGGFRSVIRTDWIQFGLMYAAFMIMVAVLFFKHGGMDFLAESLPDTHFAWHGGASVGYVVSWYFIAMSALVEPAFYQRCYAARTPETARKGLFMSIGFWMLFDFLTTSSGMYARAILPELSREVNAFPLLADRILPMGLKGLFLVGLATTIQSTIDSYGFLAASTFGRDIIWRLRRGRRDGEQISLTKWGLVVSGVAAVGIAVSTDSVIDIWHSLGSLGTPALLLPLALSYNAKLKFRPAWAMANLLLTPAAVGYWFLRIAGFGEATPEFPFNVQPIYVGLLLSIVLLIFDHGQRRI